jgi:hypothetical protein
VRFEECFKEFECLEEREISSFCKLVSSETRLWRCEWLCFGREMDLRDERIRSRNGALVACKNQAVERANQAVYTSEIPTPVLS